jgi:uncharacterized membrane protein
MKGKGVAIRVAFTSIFAALYASLTIALAPLSFYEVQVRVSDSLLALSILFGPPVIIGTSLGCFIANLIGPFGIIDALGGSVANLIATYIGWKLRRRRAFALIQMPITVSLVVSTYLHVLLNLPLIIVFLYLLAGSVISIDIMGLLLLRVIEARYGDHKHDFKQ